MPKVHTVSQGEHLGSIAVSYGFGSYEPIWNHARNKELRNLRTDPLVLYPGDQVFIPDLQPKTITGATEQRHRIVVKTGKLKVRLRLLDSLGFPLASEPCELSVGGD